MKVKIFSLVMLCFMSFALIGGSCSSGGGGEYSDGRYESPERLRL